MGRYTGSDRKELQKALRDAGFYSTEGRLNLLGLLKRSHKPLSVPAITAYLDCKLDEVSVYRALEALAKRRLLVRTDIRRGGAHYEYAGHHHHHLVCSECGVTEDVKECPDLLLEKRALKYSKYFASIDMHSLEFFGVCRSCRG